MLMAKMPRRHRGLLMVLMAKVPRRHRGLFMVLMAKVPRRHRGLFMVLIAKVPRRHRGLQCEVAVAKRMGKFCPDEVILDSCRGRKIKPRSMVGRSSMSSDIHLADFESKNRSSLRYIHYNMFCDHLLLWSC